MLSVHDKLRNAFRVGKLKTRSVSPEGKMEWKCVTDVHRAEVPWEEIRRVDTKYGHAYLTKGHRVFVSPVIKKNAGDLVENDSVLGIDASDTVFYPSLTSIAVKPSRKYMYDLTVADWHNFVLFDSRMVISNCPDKFYHFRPPEYEGDIGQYNRIFGQIWEDEELLEYLLRSLDWFNMFPPLTQKINTLTILLQAMPAWRTAILWGAITHACFALSINWVADEFSVRGDQEVTVVTKSGKEISLSIQELYEICKN